MPNPLMQGRIITSKSKVDPAQVAIEPVPEDYEGYNIPYRGVVDHGVDSDAEFRDTDEDMPDHDGRKVPVYEPEEKDVDPIPVYLVNRSSRERRAFRTIVGYAGRAPRLILGLDDARTAAIILNPSETDTVYIGERAESASAFTGWPLAPGQGYRTESQDTVYVYADTDDSVMVNVAVEYRRPLDE